MHDNSVMLWLQAEYYSSKIRGSKPLSFVSCPRSRDIIVTYIAVRYFTSLLHCL